MTAPGLFGGTVVGGGLLFVNEGSPGSAATYSTSDSRIADLTATGGHGVASGGGTGGAGGEAQGGGIYVDPGQVITVTSSTIAGHQAFGGVGGMGTLDGLDGTGLSGGIFLGGSGSTMTGSRPLAILGALPRLA